MENKSKTSIRRIGGYLHRVIPIVDSAGRVLDYAVKPLMVEFRPRDMMQVIVGASILAVPVAFTEETWNLGENLPLANVLALSSLSILFIAFFTYFNFYRSAFKGHVHSYILRVVGTYGFSLLVVGGLMTLIQQCPWTTDFVLAAKRVLIVSFPASMSAAVSDAIK
ncbi:MAG: DUF2391 family protein [Desulfonatronovibrionaceae bacterium]